MWKIQEEKKPNPSQGTILTILEDSVMKSQWFKQLG
jgi:hypothetical protein